jgi:hypothetical protein
MQLLSEKRIGNFTGSEGYKLFMPPSITERQLFTIKKLQEKPKLTDKQAEELEYLIEKRDTPKTTAERDTYIRIKAEERATGFQHWFSSKSTTHGEIYEIEAHQAFSKVSGLIVVHNEQEYLEINENCGTTPDAKIIGFDNLIKATVDYKCPVSTFFEQKLIYVNKLNPQWQYTTKDKFYQAHWQMLAADVQEHYLVRYLPKAFEDKSGNYVENKLPLEARIFWQVIKRDEKICDEIKSLVAIAAAERDLLVKIFEQQIIFEA